MDWVSLGVDAAAVGLLIGIFHRLGRLAGIIAGHDARIGSLEAWRDHWVPRV